MTVACTIDANGIVAPTYDQILTYVQGLFRSIYGDDVYIEPDSQDGQLLAIFALALHDVNSQAIAVYQAFSPSTAQGVGLSRVVKINGIARLVPSRSTVDLLCVGQTGTVVTGGVASDTQGNRWDLADFVIPLSGEITVSATAQKLGSIRAPKNTVTTIATATRGWQSVTNLLPATVGAEVESDSALKARQKVSTALPSNTVLEGLIGAVAEVPSVTRYRAYENDHDGPDVNGQPGHSIAVVVEGGDAATIAARIATKKAPGTGTYGTTAVTVTDAYGIPRVISFFRPVPRSISVVVHLKPLAGFTSAVQAKIQSRVADYINSLPIGDDLVVSRLYGPATLTDKETPDPDENTYAVSYIEVGITPGPLSRDDMVLAFNEAAQTTSFNVSINPIS